VPNTSTGCSPVAARLVSLRSVPYATVVDVMLILARGHELLLSLRERTGYDGLWNLSSGKLEEGEDAVAALGREAREELGIHLEPDTTRLAGVVHCRNPEGEGRLGLFFVAPSDLAKQGEPYNAEPHKCAKLGWFTPEMLPHNTVPYTTAGIGLYLSGEPFTTLGWGPSPAW
jgi:8-oxo-dGTP diphosphatase